MKLGEIIANRDAIGRAYDLRLKNGARTLRLRAVLAQLNEQLKRFEELKDSYIRATGKEQLGPGDPEFADVVKHLNEALEADVDVKVDAAIEMADVESVELSVREIEGLLALGLINMGAAPQPVAPAPAKRKARK